MGKLKTVADLHKLREKVCQNADQADRNDIFVHLKVAMATCSIASGARDTLHYMTNELKKRNIDAVITQTGCMGYCYAEPTVEVKIAGKEPLIFGYVDLKKADEIIQKYILNDELVEGIIPMNYRNTEDTVN